MPHHLLTHLFPSNESFGYEALRAAGYSNCGASDIGEVITICHNIPPGDEDRWLQEWKAAGHRAVANAKISLSKGNTVGAREAFLRASNYFRTAEFYRRENPHDDQLSKELADASIDTFYKAAELMPYVTTKVAIPYEGTTLPGIMMRPDANDKPRPLIIVNGGFDSTMEEIVYSVGGAALQLGMNVLAFDGPGQGSAVRNQKLFFRHDWEKVVTPVVDFALSHPFVDKSKLVLVGLSMGGYLAARASAFEHRLAAVVLNDGVFDFGSVFLPKEENPDPNAPDMSVILATDEHDEQANVAIRQGAALNTGFKWAMNNAKYVFGLNSEAGTIREAQKYTLKDVVEQIKTPTLVLDAPDDHFMKGQPEELFHKMKCEKELVTLTAEEGASLHCHVGAGSRLGQVMMDWVLDKLSSV
ncbi:dipeptidyl aminopeptidase/acylaminoacyl peptidase [Pochonia chlamydosporia 170]|uniref:Dipeptidyl aminopeptidase/acylaminoacyl peptidase n=1 Tax=Pochonia chlamydosporia 170 TaxID=1380566 RepID=A0A179G9Y1_METCM|nr:dipeptidyl aminopeptidase/acylaminoacyl peptidase [Pochonia chlamydosporia 170]OAQ74193.1 dipeptidyl aminopeptidase/acylaminoacyl peptidase [Pochonia chlamydosporia 170]